MIKRKRILALMAVVAVLGMVLATAGAASAGWEWCSDPILSIGNDSVGFSRVNVDVAVDGGISDYSSAVTVAVPEDIVVQVVDPQGSTVEWATDGGLRLNRRVIQTEMTVLLTLNNPADSAEKFMVTVSVNGKTVTKGVGRVGEAVTVRANIPVAVR